MPPFPVHTYSKHLYFEIRIMYNLTGKQNASGVNEAIHFLASHVPPRVLHSSQSGQNVCFIVSQYSVRFGRSSGDRNEQMKQMMRLQIHVNGLYAYVHVTGIKQQQCRR